MKGKSSFVSGLQHLSRAKQFFEDFKRDSQSHKSREIVNAYLKKIDWTLTDAKTNILFSDVLCTAVAAELKADSFSVDAIAEKAALLPAGKREVIESLMDAIISGNPQQLIDNSVKLMA